METKLYDAYLCTTKADKSGSVVQIIGPCTLDQLNRELVKYVARLQVEDNISIKVHK